jgi:hypothetical protein
MRAREHGDHVVLDATGAGLVYARGIMEAPNKIDTPVVAGYAVGVGLIAVATLGVYWHFWQPTTSVWVWGLGSFAVGALLGGAYAAWRRAKL